jgi:flagellar basal-body rod protein FlgG
MLRAFSTAATGMSAQQRMVDNVANNLANINTVGFKRSQVNFQDLLYWKIREAGREVASGVTAPSGLELGSGVRIASTNRVFTMGQLQSTGRSLDVAIQGDGFIEVVNANGESRYTRDGTLQMDADGQLVTAAGLTVGSGITIPSDFVSIDVAKDGTVNVQTASGNQVAGTIELVRFPNPAGLSAEGGNLYKATEASGSAIAGIPGQDGLGTLLSGHLEKSNVEMVSELVDMISAQRAYEINSRCIRVGDDMLLKLNRIIR